MGKKFIVSVDDNLKEIYLNMNVEPTKAEEAILNALVPKYKVITKNPKKSAAMKKKADRLNDNNIIAALSDDEDGKKQYKDMKEQKGFLIAKKWYYSHEIKKELKKDEKALIEYNTILKPDLSGYTEAKKWYEKYKSAKNK